MYINPKWRILTVGDGDLSFSSALLHYLKPEQLTATVFDDIESLTDKYGDQFFQQLTHKDNNQCQVITGFDVTNDKSWGSLVKHQYDVIIFQFPLLPAFKSLNEYQQVGMKVSQNILHRRLLRHYLLHCFKYFLDKNGAQLAFITSKDVKPYCQWNIESALTINTDINYVGSIDFMISQFPGYKIRNVDRDKHVKDTLGITYIYSTKQVTELDDKIKTVIVHQHPYCQLCRVGPFYSAQDHNKHLLTKKHRQMVEYEQQWLDDLSHFSYK